MSNNVRRINLITVTYNAFVVMTVIHKMASVLLKKML